MKPVTTQANELLVRANARAGAASPTVFHLLYAVVEPISPTRPAVEQVFPDLRLLESSLAEQVSRRLDGSEAPATTIEALLARAETTIRPQKVGNSTVRLVDVPALLYLLGEDEGIAAFMRRMGFDPRAILTALTEEYRNMSRRNAPKIISEQDLETREDDVWARQYVVRRADGTQLAVDARCSAAAAAAVIHGGSDAMRSALHSQGRKQAIVIARHTSSSSARLWFDTDGGLVTDAVYDAADPAE